MSFFKENPKCKIFREIVETCKKKSEIVRIFFTFGVDELRFMRYNVVVKACGGCRFGGSLIA